MSNHFFKKFFLTAATVACISPQATPIINL